MTALTGSGGRHRREVIRVRRQRLPPNAADCGLPAGRPCGREVPGHAALGGTLKDEQIRALVAHVRSLAKPR